MTKKTPQLSDELLQHKLRAESDLIYFIELIQPKRLLGNIHRELCQWITSKSNGKYKLVLLPRDHGKSAIAGFYAAWLITRDPTCKILYISSTSNLAVKQLKFIKDILTSEKYRLFWPEMVNEDETKREKWTEREISVDHPLRKAESIRDPSIFTAGLTSNIVGMHCDHAILDDVVVQSNAYTEEAREKVKDQYSYLASVEGTGSDELVVGTRYHPLDLYSNLIGLESEERDERGKVISKKPVFTIFERQVESVGDGSGEFLWPRQQRTDGKWFGFDRGILAEKREKYINKLHFRAQYYNDPHDVDASPIPREAFQYYDTGHIHRRDGHWYFKDQRLNIVASVDFAYSTGKTADYTCVVVVGADGFGNYYILDIDRFKTVQISEYFKHILALHEKWGFRKIRAEVSVAQVAIVTDLKESYIRPLGLSLSVEEYRPSRWEGAKDERILAVLQPKYANRQIWHYQSGNCQVLEEELLYANPAHDDVKDTLASAIDFIMGMAPVNVYRQQKANQRAVQFHNRWGGVA